MTYVDILLLLFVLCFSYFAASMLRLKFLGCSAFLLWIGAVFVMVKTIDIAIDLYIFAYKSIASQIINPLKKIIFPFFLLVQVIKIFPAINEMASRNVYNVVANVEEFNNCTESQVNIVRENFISKLSFV